jgi:hypothetical protein
MTKTIHSNQRMIAALIVVILAISGAAPISADALPDELSDQLVQQVTDLQAQPESSAPLILISQSELDALPKDTVVSWSTKPTSPEGPTIEIASPTNNATYEGSFPIKVDFRPGPKGYEVDIESLKLEYKKAWGIDITDRVREFITGTGIDVENSELPKGRHTVEIEIADIESNLSRRIFTVTVK